MGITYDITALVSLLKRIGSSGCAKAIRSIDVRLQADEAHHVLDVLYGYEEIFVGFARALRQNGKLTDKDYVDLQELFSGVQQRLQEATAVDTPLDAQTDTSLEALHLLGGVSLSPDSRTVALFLSPRMLTQAFSIATLLESASRAKHIKTISAIRGSSVTLDEAREMETRSVKPFADAVREVLRQHALQAVPTAWRGSTLATLSVELLPTATDFYEAGIDYYRDSAGRGREHYIFATTSGILLPQDYYGSAYFERINPAPELAEESDKNPKREDYFKALADVRGRPRSYFFEIKRAGTAFYKTVGKLQEIAGKDAADRYRNHSKDTIARFLQLSGFGLIGVNEFPPEYDYLTLGNGRHMFLSGRDREERKEKIGHGLWVRPRGRGLRAFAEEFKELNLAEWLSTLAVAAGISSLEDDPRLGLLEALVSGFAVPFLLAGQRYWSRQHAQDAFLNIGEHVSRTIAKVDFPFMWRADRRPLGEARAMKEAEKIISTLESVP